MLVRRATADDADPCAAVFAAVADEGAWIVTEGPVDVAEWSLRMRSSPDPMWVVEDEGGVIVGLLALHAVPRAPGVMAFGMSLVAEARGRGGGRALIEAALEHARETAVHKVELEVFPENTRAVALYARFGFAVEGLRREHYLRRDGTRRDVLLMGLILGRSNFSPPSLL